MNTTARCGGEPKIRVISDNTTSFKIQIIAWMLLNGNAVHVLLSALFWRSVREENARLIKDASHMLL
jgi:hypothetical protein